MTDGDRPILTVCIPTYRRPDLLARTLASIKPVIGRERDVEVLVSDNAPEVGASVAEPWLAVWPGPTRYLPNAVDLGAPGNHNQCIEQAGGQFVMLLHDDDFLLPDALPAILSALSDPADGRCLLFGVEVVDADGTVLRRQVGSKTERLAPDLALKRVLINSSMVRMPALVIEPRAIIEVGGFDESVGGPADFDLFIRLFGRFGLTIRSEIISAYTVHDAAQTSSMFRADVIDVLMEIFDRAVAMEVIPEPVVRQCQVEWFHQFVLGGAYRHLRVGETAEAGRIMGLLDLPSTRQLGRSRRWHRIRTIFSILVRLPPWVSRGLSAGGRRVGVERRIWMTL